MQHWGGTPGAVLPVHSQRHVLGRHEFRHEHWKRESDGCKAERNDFGRQFGPRSSSRRTSGDLHGHRDAFGTTSSDRLCRLQRRRLGEERRRRATEATRSRSPASSATCSFAAGLLARPDFYTVTATLKDPNFNTPVAGSLVQQMQKSPTSTSVSGVPSTVIAGQTFGFTITIQTQAPASGVPQGAIEWAVCSVNAPSCSGNNAPAGGTFQLPTPTKRDIKNNEQLLKFSVPGGIAPPGLYSVSATFWGAGDFQSSTSTDSNMLVKKVPTSMELFMSSNPVRSGDRLVIRVGIIGSTWRRPVSGRPRAR